ncbi:MAG: uroporphyrinogen-III C-methyltransferase [Streptosporangiaceae bacterium]
MSSTHDTHDQPAGSVTFVGAGPGDEDLLTLRGAKVLAEADAAVCDRLAGGQFLTHCGPGVEVHDAADLDHAARQRLVIDLASAGKRVVRLLNGDPALFGGVAEDAEACARAGISFEIVPGVSSAVAVPTYAGIPLTSRKAGEVRVVDAHEGAVDWESVGAGRATLVILSAVGSMGEVAKALVEAGRPGETPVAMTRDGTTTAQTTVVSTLAEVAAGAKAAHMEPPAVAVVGDVVRLRETLSWFETKPLFGWRVLVPRTKEQAGPVCDRLRGYGALPDEVPTISVEPPRTPQQLERAIKGLVTGRYQWVAFTSANAVRAVRERLEEYGLDARAFAGVKVAAVGEQTAAAVLAFGVKPDLMPAGQHSSEGLLEVWPPHDKLLDPIDRVFLPRADIATETLVAGLHDLGWEVDDITAYRTVRAAPPPAQVREAIKGGSFDAVLFTSSSTVRNLVGIAGKPHATTVVAAIGPKTAKTAEEFGLRVDVVAPKASAFALAAALAEYGAERRLTSVEAGQPVRRPSQMRRGSRKKAK